MARAKTKKPAKPLTPAQAEAAMWQLIAEMNPHLDLRRDEFFAPLLREYEARKRRPTTLFPAEDR